MSASTNALASRRRWIPSFVDESGRPVQLGKYFHGKPVILVMAYYRCPMLCTLVLNGLVQGMLDMSFNVGRSSRW